MSELPTSKQRSSLIKITDKHMTRSKIHLPRGLHYYPSEASIVIKGPDGFPKVEGGCLRRSFFRCIGGYESSPFTPYNMWIFELGKAVEAILTEQYKQMGIWVDNSIRWMNEKYKLSGEIDILIKDPDDMNKIIPLEIKSFYSYYATKEICGSRGQAGRPKISHLLQIVIYLNECRHLFEYGKLVYYARDSSNRAEFNVELWDEQPGVTRVVVNGQVERRFTVQDIYNRYKLLDDHIQKKEIPKNDHELHYNEEKVERLYKLGEVSKTAYTKFKDGKAKAPGDFQCNYCPYTYTVCWKRNGKPKI